MKILRQSGSERAAGIVLTMLVGASLSSGADGEADLGSFLGQPRYDTRELFVQNCRFPNIVVAADGTVLALIGTPWLGPIEERRVKLRRSIDGGKTWEQPRVVFAGWMGGGCTVNETTGEILAFAEDEMTRSGDHGVTWSPLAPVSIAKDVRGNRLALHMNGTGITLRRGDKVGRLIRAARCYGPGNGRQHYPKHYTSAIFSDDGGKTWNPSVPLSGFGFGEAGIVELSDGRLYYNARRHWNGDPENPPLRRHYSHSIDGGSSWSRPQVVKALPDGPQGNAYGCFGGFTRLPVKGRDILLYSNCDTPKIDRKDGTIWASFDAGQTWPIKRRIRAKKGAGFGYSSIATGRAGTKSEGWIYCFFEVYQDGEYEPKPAGNEHDCAHVGRFSLSWILEGEPTGDGNLPEWISEGRSAAAE